MKTNNQNSGNSDQVKDSGKQPQVNQSKNRDRNTSDKKEIYIKDLPPIDGAMPGVLG